MRTVRDWKTRRNVQVSEAAVDFTVTAAELREREGARGKKEQYWHVKLVGFCDQLTDIFGHQRDCGEEGVVTTEGDLKIAVSAAYPLGSICVNDQMSLSFTSGRTDDIRIRRNGKMVGRASSMAYRR